MEKKTLILLAIVITLSISISLDMGFAEDNSKTILNKQEHKIGSVLQKKLDATEKDKEIEVTVFLKTDNSIDKTDIKQKRKISDLKNSLKTVTDQKSITEKGKILENENKKYIQDISKKIAYKNEDIYSRLMKDSKGTIISSKKHLGIVTIKTTKDMIEQLAEKEYTNLILIADRNKIPLLDKSVPSINTTRWWDNNYTGGWIDVAVVDTGVNKSHPYLTHDSEGNTRIWYQKDFTDDNNNIDYHSHGTHCSGIVASSDSTYTGVAKGVDAFIASKFLAPNSGSQGNSIDAVDWTINPGDITDPAEVVSNS